MKLHDSVFIGAGASALMAASHLKGCDVALIERNATFGEKIRISGGGKCNLTNRFTSENNYLGDPAFIQAVLRRFTPEETLRFVTQGGIAVEERSHGQIFCARSAKELIALFSRLCDTHTCYTNTTVLHVSHQEHFIVHTNRGDIGARKLIIASGGLSYASVGASGIGYEIAKYFGHTITPPLPALVGFTVQKDQFWMKELSGIAFEVSITVEGKVFRENLLFAHKGISGPAVLSASLYWKKGALSIDFLPSLILNTLRHSKKQISTALGLPKRFIKAFLESIRLEDKVMHVLTHEEWERLQVLKHYTFSPAGNFGFTKAEVTKGGVCTDEIDPETMQSLTCNDLFFIGEVLDVTGELGGFNFQWAFASGYVCAQALRV